MLLEEGAELGRGYLGVETGWDPEEMEWVIGWVVGCLGACSALIGAPTPTGGAKVRRQAVMREDAACPMIRCR